MKVGVTAGHIRALCDGWTEERVRVTELDPGSPHSNSIWLVEEPEQAMVVRVCLRSEDPCDSFWHGMQLLFGANPRLEVPYYTALTDLLRRIGNLPVPRVLNVALAGSSLDDPVVIVQRLDGQPVRYETRSSQFIGRPALAEQLGRHVGRLHAASEGSMGNVSRTVCYDGVQFAERLVSTLEQLSSRWWADDRSVRAVLPEMVRRAVDMPRPDTIAWIMPDLGPTQFLVDDMGITGLVDIESYVRGPIELELAVLELWLEHVATFRRGYVQYRELPSLREWRELYRFLIYLMYDAPPRRYEEWRDAPPRFDVRA